MTTKHTLLLLSLMMIGTGCRDDSARVAHVAERALTQQAEQNAEMARLNRDVTETTQQLVEADAKARQDVLAAQRDIQTQQNGVNQQRDSLEQERRDIVDATQSSNVFDMLRWQLAQSLMPLRSGVLAAV